MSAKFYAMDTCFLNELGDYPLDVRCEMLAELGFTGTYLTLWNNELRERAWSDAERFVAESRRHGLEAAGVYVALDLGDVETRDRVLRFLPTLPPGCAVEISLRAGNETLANSSEDGDDAALRLLAPLLAAVDAERNPICLYAHVRCWLERHEDALRLVRKSGHPALGWVFSTYHWYASQEGRLLPLLDEGLPRLRRVNVCGTRRTAEGGYTLEPLDGGTLDLPAILGQIWKRGYAGPVGIQGYGVGGDVYGRLERGLSTLREWKRRCERQPHWADLRAGSLPGLCGPGAGPLWGG
jgi:sugar phosphate isomerase/epimerase